jgi:hypothetical protein
MKNVTKQFRMNDQGSSNILTYQGQIEPERSQVFNFIGPSNFDQVKKLETKVVNLEMQNQAYGTMLDRMWARINADNASYNTAISDLAVSVKREMRVAEEDFKVMNNVIVKQREVIDQLRTELQQQRDLLNRFHQELSSTTAIAIADRTELSTLRSHLSIISARVADTQDMIMDSGVILMKEDRKRPKESPSPLGVTCRMCGKDSNFCNHRTHVCSDPKGHDDSLCDC